MLKTVIFIILFFTITQLLAQHGQITFDHYGLDAGFNSREAMDIVTTPNGMVWVSSNDGLVRYDSKGFKFYKHIQGDANSLSNNYCKALANDKRGLIWIQSDDDLNVFNPATETFVHIKIIESKNETRPVYPLIFSYDSVKDIMWIGTSKGLYFSKNGSYILQSAAAITAEKTLASAMINTISDDGSGVLWISSGNTIIKLHTLNGHTEKFMMPTRVDGIVNDKKIFNFKSSLFDTNKTLWLGSWINGLVEFNTLTKTFHQYCYRDYTREENTIFDIAQIHGSGTENTLWLSTAGYGLATFNMVTKKFTCYSTRLPHDPFGITGTTYGLFLDTKNSLWIGSATGLHQYDYGKQSFNRIDLSNIYPGISHLPVSSLAVQQTKNGHDEIIWFYIPYKGAYLYHLTQNKILTIPNKVEPYFNMPSAVLGFYIDSKNILWISTVTHGLTGYNINEDAIVFTEKILFAQKWKWVSCFFEDDKKQLWIGTYNGMYVMDSSRKKVVSVIAVNDGLKRKGLSIAIEDITSDKYGNIWFTADATDKKMAAIGNFNPTLNALQIIYNESLQQGVNRIPVGLGSIVCNKQGKIFVSFLGEGIAWFDSNTAAFTPHFLNTESGLKSNRINGLIADSIGSIWCSTTFGISSYKPSQNIFTNYSGVAYALDNIHTPAIYLSAQSGKIYVGQSNAISYFNPYINKASAVKNNLEILEIKVLNQILRLQNEVPKSGATINLAYHENMISIEFALLSYNNAKENRYSWILEGWDKDWVISKNNLAAYTNLKPGTYIFRVKAANSEGLWTDQPVTLTIKMAYPFYQTWWFIFLCAVGFASILYWLVQQPLKRIKDKFQLRNKIAADLHDEIGSTLTSISILSHVSQQVLEQEPKQVKELLQQILAQCKTIQQNMSDIVWSIRTDNEKVEDLIIRMREYAGQTLEHLDIATTIESDDELAAKTLPMQHRKELLLIYKEAINNIAKHAGAKRVSITLKNGHLHIILCIADDGIWKGHTSGTGIRSMKARAATLGGKIEILNSEKGTKVMAIIPVP